MMIFPVHMPTHHEPHAPFWIGLFKTALAIAWFATVVTCCLAPVLIRYLEDGSGWWWILELPGVLLFGAGIALAVLADL